MPVFGKFKGYNRCVIADVFQDMILIIYIQDKQLLYWLFTILYMTSGIGIILYIIN